MVNGSLTMKLLEETNFYVLEVCSPRKYINQLRYGHRQHDLIINLCIWITQFSPTFIFGCGQNTTGKNVTGQNVTIKRHTDNTPHRQNATGLNATQTKCHRTERHTDKISQDQIQHRQNATGQNVTQTKCHRVKRHLDKAPPRQNVTGQNITQFPSFTNAIIQV